MRASPGHTGRGRTRRYPGHIVRRIWRLVLEKRERALEQICKSPVVSVTFVPVLGTTEPGVPGYPGAATQAPGYPGTLVQMSVVTATVVTVMMHHDTWVAGQSPAIAL
eukprot:1843336-Rhodomonas_salina.1